MHSPVFLKLFKVSASGRRYILKTLVALERLRLIMQTLSVGIYMRKSAYSVLRVSIGFR